MMNVNTLIEKAIEARSKSYSPYSKFKVGAAILLKNGDYILGCNVENASYRLCNCAERTSLFSLIAQGYNPKDVVEMVIDIFSKTDSSCYERQTDFVVERAYSVGLLTELLKKNNFDVLGVFGDMTECSPEEDEERLYFLAKKK